MKLYYCTFGIGSRMSQYVQPIYATTEQEAEEKMKEVFGNNYSFCYPEADFIESKGQGHFNSLIELRPLYTKDTMTFGEMRQWNDRLNQILGASQVNVYKRLLQLWEDFCGVYSFLINTGDPFIKGMRDTILSYYQQEIKANVS